MKHNSMTVAAIIARRSALEAELKNLDLQKVELEQHTKIIGLVDDCLAEVAKLTGRKQTIADLMILTRAPSAQGDKTKRLTPTQLASLEIELTQRLSDIKAHKIVESMRMLAKRYGFSTQTMTTRLNALRTKLAAQSALDKVETTPAAIAMMIETPDPMVEALKPAEATA